MSSLPEYLDQFQAYVQRQTIPSISRDGFPWVWSYQGSLKDTPDVDHTFHIGVSVMIHGNEVGPLEGLLDVMEALETGRLEYPGRFTCFIGNPEAGLQDRRFLDVDLNRVFNGPHSFEDSDTHEHKRAKELCSILDQFDLYIDFHQTLLDVQQPFYIGPWDLITWHWMRLMQGAQVWVTRHPHYGGGGLLCADEYVRKQGKPSIALELGALGWSATARSGVWKCLSQAFHVVHQDAHKGSKLDAWAQSRPDLQFYETCYRHPFDHPALRLQSGWLNFSQVVQGQVLTHDPKDGSSPISAPCDGALLFPKYPPRDEAGLALDPRPKELFRIVSPLSGHPLELWESKENSSNET
jgi:succinylglutamate desuccinylase